MDRIMDLIDKALGRERVFQENSLVWIEAFDKLAAKPENRPSWINLDLSTEDCWTMDDYIGHEHGRA